MVAAHGVHERLHQPPRGPGRLRRRRRDRQVQRRGALISTARAAPAQRDRRARLARDVRQEAAVCARGRPPPLSARVRVNTPGAPHPALIRAPAPQGLLRGMAAAGAAASAQQAPFLPCPRKTRQAASPVSSAAHSAATDGSVELATPGSSICGRARRSARVCAPGPRRRPARPKSGAASRPMGTVTVSGPGAAAAPAPP